MENTVLFSRQTLCIEYVWSFTGVAINLLGLARQIGLQFIT